MPDHKSGATDALRRMCHKDPFMLEVINEILNVIGNESDVDEGEERKDGSDSPSALGILSGALWQTTDQEIDATKPHVDTVNDSGQLSRLNPNEATPDVQATPDTEASEKAAEASNQTQESTSALQRLSVVLWPSVQQETEQSGVDVVQDKVQSSYPPDQAGEDIVRQDPVQASSISSSNGNFAERPSEEIAPDTQEGRMSISEQWASALNGVLYGGGGGASDAIHDEAELNASHVKSLQTRESDVDVAAESFPVSLSERAQAWITIDKNHSFWQLAAAGTTSGAAEEEAAESESSSSESAGRLASSRVSAAPTTAGSEEGQDSSVADDQPRTSIWSNAWISSWSSSAQAGSNSTGDSEETSGAAIQWPWLEASSSAMTLSEEQSKVDGEDNRTDHQTGQENSFPIGEMKVIWKRTPSVSVTKKRK
eukprot:gnl/MRDRNA2_/MRDRNA2_150376_c0_seq1.p1 gnl/MRDRNA2_/MRDRNA2_150376_c0~~gnl/MRDRNA2_/MRDRNA2_150376_c0_seq1.p1  ORF type:complete len:455 (-),score=109.03 gnl/MRDRNA2_/MRDRNA2_150376_c0_seq1:22-1299(-)